MKYGILGRNIQYTGSKKLFETCFDYEYDIVDTNVISKGQLLEYNGMNVTTPYKQLIINYLDSLDEISDETNSVNCIKNRDGQLVGYNTDYYGLKATLDKYGLKSMLILGNGGVCPTIQKYAKDNNIEATVCGRSGKYDVSFNEVQPTKYDCIVNATKFGVLPNIDYSIVPKDTLMFDLCYGTSTTFLDEAKKNGLKNCIDGSEMLVAQAAKSYKIWGLV